MANPLEQPLHPANLYGLNTPFDVAATISARLIVSAEPAVVLTSLAAACVPGFSDECVVKVIENERASYRVCAPTPAGTTPLASDAVPAGRIMTIFEGTPCDTDDSYRGVITHTWHGRATTLTDVAVARMIADRAVAHVTAERLTVRAARAESNAADLQVALQHSRQIGAAIGVLMATRRITDENAFALLVDESRNYNRTLRDTAHDVVARRGGGLRDERLFDSGTST